jgi:hypothetical protein
MRGIAPSIAIVGAGMGGLTVMGGADVGRSRTKWWGIDRHIVIYYTKRDRSEIDLITSVPEPAEWLTPESWSVKGDVRDLRASVTISGPRSSATRRTASRERPGSRRSRARTPG